MIGAVGGFGSKDMRRRGERSRACGRNGDIRSWILVVVCGGVIWWGGVGGLVSSLRFGPWSNGD